ncbi:GUN4 domain-containing protein [Scytonema sp. NUACC26]|uniref:GUN4 domain-containing protein n=1 Tax=Scytonema sp. NUACC26 TaxID=3140176 RepID=UPI0034DC27D8
MISVAELHEYAKRKVQEAQPAMKPEIFAVREGYTIHLAKAPLGDPRLEYRKEVEQCVKNGGFLVQKNCFRYLAYAVLNEKQNELGIKPEEAKGIEEEVLQPFRKYQKSLGKYEEVLVKALQEENVLSNVSGRRFLKRLQQILKLQDEDVTPIHERLIPSQQPISSTPQPTLPPTKAITTEEDDLKSEKGLDYTKLQNLLVAGKWEEANQETYLVMLQAIGRQEGDWIREREILNFPCTDLCTINQLWVKYSNGHFGFSIQKRIYLDVGGMPDGKYSMLIYSKYCDRVGWKVNGKWIDQIIFDTSAPVGHLPRCRSEHRFLASRLVKCNI